MKDELKTIIENEFDEFYFQNKRKFCFLNDLVTWFQKRFGLNHEADSIKEAMIELGYDYENKHVRFADNTTKSDRILFKEYDGDMISYPERKVVIKNEVLIYFLNKILSDRHNLNIQNIDDIVDMSIFVDEDGNEILMFHNKVMREYIMQYSDHYNFSEEHMRRMMTLLRKYSDKSYIRRNVYTKKSSTIQDKVFYKYNYNTVIE